MHAMLHVDISLTFTVEFFGSLPTDAEQLSVTIESSANTVGLDITFLMWNFTFLIMLILEEERILFHPI